MTLSTYYSTASLEWQAQGKKTGAVARQEVRSMKRSLVLLLLALFCVSGLAFAVEQYSPADTAVAAVNVPFSWTWSADHVSVKNVGANNLWVDFRDTTATAGTANEFLIEPGETKIVNGEGLRGIGVISVAGGTLVRVQAYRKQSD